MKCIYCNTPLAGIQYCPGCGADVSLLKRIGRISNLLYNRGLEKASIRDMSGAIACLSQSVKFNKENIDARNLLGLCYYETGEVVSALCEWVISKNMSPVDNPADAYINDLRNNKNQLDTINQSIRKYNQSIEYCQSGHEDMAIMQLRKVISSNPKLVKAQQLLALLYYKNHEYEKSRRVLRRALAIDNTNTTTLRYLSEIEEVTGKSSLRRRRKEETEQRSTESGTLRYVSGTETIIQPTTFRDSSTIATFINIGLGILLGGAVVWFLAMPANRQRASEEANAQVSDAQAQLASGSAQLADLQAQIEGYQQQVETAQQQAADAEAEVQRVSDLMAAAGRFVNGETTAAVDALGQIDGDSLEGEAKTLYDSLTTAVGATMFTQYYTAGTTAYVEQNYQEAAAQLQNAVDADPDGTQQYYYDALYYLGFAYYNMGDTSRADEVFNLLIEKYPSQASAVQPYLSSSTGSYGAESSGTVSQGEASMSQEQITIIDDGTQNLGYDESQVAWTDPTTGLHYDAYGNLLG